MSVHVKIWNSKTLQKKLSNHVDGSHSKRLIHGWFLIEARKAR